mmetsp:Transcript_39839/g.109652  ORF Transcript_39839/g.109652 Transcript_39839/m.109652 type:complete len:181 (+) Transcript_39839:65-607(+)
MPIDYSKFDNIEDSDEEIAPKKMASPPTTAGATEAASPIAKAAAAPPKVAKEHCTSLEDAPPLELPEGAFLQYYKEKMTAPQRMQTLVQLWNSAEQTDRVEFLRHLIDIIGNPAISNRIKGGQEVLKDLDESFYQGVTYPGAWVMQFKEKFTIDDRKVVFEKLFKTLDSQERGLVLGTLM